MGLTQSDEIMWLLRNLQMSKYFLDSLYQQMQRKRTQLLILSNHQLQSQHPQPQKPLQPLLQRRQHLQQRHQPQQQLQQWPVNIGKLTLR